MSPTFHTYFYKHFPQLQGKLTKHQMKAIYTFTEQITGYVDCHHIWQALEADPKLMNDVALKIKLLLKGLPLYRRPEVTLFILLILVFGCLISVVMFQHNLQGTVLNMISFIIGILGACIKESYGKYFSTLVEDHAPDEDPPLLP